MIDPRPVRFIRHIWPRLSQCPDCGVDRWRDAGYKGSVHYRRCKGCLHTYPMLPVAKEVYRGGQVSEVFPI